VSSLASVIPSIGSSVANTSNALGNLTSALTGANNAATSANNASTNTGTAGSSPSGSAATAAAGTAATTLGSNFNTFLTLLTTQLQNQDPLSPLDSNQFTQQLVEFSQVEQQINTNNNLTSLLGLQSQADTIDAQSLVGKTAQFNSANAALVNGQASYSYTLPATAAATILAITNSAGSVVWSGSGQTAAGNYNFTWNGQDFNGDSQPAGTYTLAVTAVDGNGNAITPTITSFGAITAVGSQNGTTTLSVGTTNYPLSQLDGMQSPSS
jgi:flagellar basal-body rod modification protein FlgD